MATTAHTHTNGRTSPTLNTHNYNCNSVHRKTTSVDSSYSAFFTSGLLSPPSSPAMSPTSPSTSTSPFSSPFTNRHQPPSSRNPKMKVTVNVNAHRALPSTSMLELASPSSSYGGDALYFVALLQHMEDGEEDPIDEDEEDDAEGEGGEGEKERDLRELTSFLSLDASSASQYTRSTRTKTRTGRPTTLGSSTSHIPFPASHPHSSYPHSRPNSNPREQPRSPTASTSSTSTSTSTSTSASVSPITPPSYPFSQHQQHPHHPHLYHADSNSQTPIRMNTDGRNVTKSNNTTTTTTTTTNGKSTRTATDHPRSFLPSLRLHSPSHMNNLLPPPSLLSPPPTSPPLLPPIPSSIPFRRNNAPSKGNAHTHAPTRIPSLTLPPPIVSSFVFDDDSESDSLDSGTEEDTEEEGEDACGVSHPVPMHNRSPQSTHRTAKRVDGKYVGERERGKERVGGKGKHVAGVHGGAHTAPLLASFPAPPPTSLALRLSLHLPKTSLFFDDLEDDILDEEVEGVEGEVGEGEEGAEGEEDAVEEGARESYLSLASPTSPPPQRQATRKPSNPPSHTRKPSTTRRTVGSRKSSTRRTPAALSPLARTPSNALSFSRPFTRSLSQKAKWRGKRFTQVSTTSSASVSTGYRTCMRADALAALEGRVLGSCEASGRGGGRHDEMAEERKDKNEEEGGEGGGEGEVLMSTWSDEEDGGDLWEDDEEDDDLLVEGEELEQEWAEVEGEGEGERRAEMSWMDFNPPAVLSPHSSSNTSSKSSKWEGPGGLSRGLSSKSYKWKSMYSISTSIAAFAAFATPAAADTEEEEERPFSASSTSLPNLPFPSTTSTSTSTSAFPSTYPTFPSTLSASSSSTQASTLSSPTIQFGASSPTSPLSPTAMLSPLSYSESFALRALSFALPPKSSRPSRQQVSQPQPLALLTNHLSKGKTAGVKEKGMGMREGREKKERGKGMTSFMFIDTDERAARRTREKGGFGKSFIDF